MMTQSEIETLLIFRVETWLLSCNSHHQTTVAGQIQGLLAGLTGKRPPRIEDPRDVLDAAGIPYKTIPGGFEYDDDWLLAHGFVFEPGSEPEDLRQCHPSHENW